MNEKENIVQLDFAEEMKNSYRDYAMSVIVARALPDVRDGLKPVQRRILFSMAELGLFPDKPHRKSARIVGDTMGKYHPHGDTSIYDALVHMSEEYSLTLPLVDGHGNFGSIDGDGAAAMRYTEARLSKSAMTLLSNLDKELVEFIPNFDNSEQEPSVLPAMIPNLLINGTTGIAVGMATNIPPHNPVEVIDGVIACMDHPDITLKQLMKYIPAPDFPTGGIITNKSELASIYETGEGKIKIRAKVEIEDGENGRKNIIVTEIPYTVTGNKTKLVENLVTLMKDKVFDEIYDVRDESSKEGIRIVIEVKKGRDVHNLLNGLYKKTSLEDTYGVNLLAVKDQQPIVFTLKRLIEEFITFQEELYTKEYKHRLQNAKSRLEIVDGLIRATDVIDLIIEILRGSSSLKQAKDCLTTGNTSDIKFRSNNSKKAAASLDFTKRQAEAILVMPLGRLIGLEILKLHEEQASLSADITEYRQILDNKKELYKVIKARLKGYRKLFSNSRRTELEDIENIIYREEIKVEDVYILIDKFGYTKSLDSASYTRASEDSLKEYYRTIPVKSTDRLCIFTSEGNMYQIKVSAIPKGKMKDKGSLIHNLCKIGTEEILLYCSVENLLSANLVFTTKNGFIKQVPGTDFQTVRSVIHSTKLEAEDKLISVILLRPDEAADQKRKVILCTHRGLALGFRFSEVVEMKKSGRGVKAIQLESDDFLIFSSVFSPDEEFFECQGKKYNTSKVRFRKRGQKGQKYF